MNTIKKLDLSDALLKRGKSPAQLPPSADPTSLLPVSEMAMVLTLDQVRPNPDNPRTTRNPRYEDIKASIRTRGLDSIPKVTRDPDGEDIFIFSDGGNTRYQILCELWQETNDERYYRLHTIFKPWPGRLQCVIGHLAENEIRGDLTYIEKAFGIHKARTIWEEQLGKSVSLRELSDLLNQQGYPIHSSSISRMEDTLKFLYPHLPDLLDSGLSRAQVITLLSLRSAAEKTWAKHCINVEPQKIFDDVFSTSCVSFNNLDAYSLDMFRDELIGQLLKALPHPALNYDRWLIELDPKEQQRRELYGDPPPMPSAVSPAEDQPQDNAGQNVIQLAPQKGGNVPVTGLRSGTLTAPMTRPEPAREHRHEDDVPELSLSKQGGMDIERPTFKTEIQPDLYGGTTAFSRGSSDSDGVNGSRLFSALGEARRDEATPASSVSFAATGLEPVSDIWHIPALLDDCEHLQDMAYRLAFELAEAMGCKDSVHEDKSHNAAGYTASPTSTDAFVLFLNGMTGNHSHQTLSMFAFCLNFFGSPSKSDTPVFDDVHVVKVMRLMRVLRRLRQLQRDALNGGSDVI